jgi:esterase/lipase
MHAIIIPGFLASDKHTKELRENLRNEGIVPWDWGGGINFGYGFSLFLKDAYDKSLDRIIHANRLTGDPIHLVGWSLGGTIACDITQKYPYLVKSVTTICSPSKRLELIRPSLCIVAKHDRVVPKQYSNNKNANIFVELDGNHTNIINSIKTAKTISEFIKNA